MSRLAVARQKYVLLNSCFEASAQTAVNRCWHMRMKSEQTDHPIFQTPSKKMIKEPKFAVVAICNFASGFNGYDIS